MKTSEFLLLSPLSLLHIINIPSFRRPLIYYIPVQRNPIIITRSSVVASYDVRYTLVQELTALGAFRGTTPNPMRLGLDSRSKDVVEPIIRPQVGVCGWWGLRSWVGAEGIDCRIRCARVPAKNLGVIFLQQSAVEMV